MSVAKNLSLVPVEVYLAGELTSPIKHEYLGGMVYALAGARNVHNLLTGNVFGSLHARLRGRRCRPFNSETKIRIRLPTQVRFYYPDVSVICRPIRRVIPSRTSRWRSSRCCRGGRAAWMRARRRTLT